MKSGRPHGEVSLLKAQVSAMEHLMEVYEKSVLEQSDRLVAEIDQRKRHIETLRLRQRAIDSSSNGMVITDATLKDNPIIYVNPAFESITGYSASEVIGKNPRFLMGEDRRQMGSERIRAAISKKTETRAVLRNYRKDGAMFWNDLKVAPVKDEAGRVTHFVGVQNDISEIKRYEQEMERQANYDSLTGLANRNLFLDRITHAIASSQRTGRPAAVAFLDIDHFKVINDSLGHGAGDRLLKVVADRLLCCIRATDTAARFGGDEFVLLFPDQPSGEGVCGIVRRVQETVFLTTLAEELRRVLAAVSEPITVTGDEIGITCSIGVSVYPQDGQDAETLLKNADAALYRAKEQGRNSFQFYTSSMNEQMVERMTMETQLRRALPAGELYLDYQPQVSLKEGRVFGAEALLRWKNPKLGQVPVSTFVTLAEETGLIIPIGEWVLKAACAQARQWRDKGLPIRNVAVNISARQFWHGGFFETIAAALEESGLDPRVLELEIVERMVVKDIEAAAAMFRKVKELGVRLSIDDFGTGYSSLSYLQMLPFDKLKIDISFVRGVTADPGKAAIVKAIIGMAHNLDLGVIAEGVETADQLDYLRRQGCDEIQGFYFGRPLPAGKLEPMLKKRVLAAQPPSNRRAGKASV